MTADITRKSAVKFIVLFGFVSLLADVTYEGARSITGPYLATLGASATVVGFVAGFGELIGYALRFVTGYLADKTRKYWLLTILGYIINLLAVPLLALANRWELAAGLIVAERFGKAIRTPARDAMLSHATKRVGTGWGFGLHEAMDQIGALMGPIIVSVVLFFRSSYKMSFAILLVPAVLAITLVIVTRFIYPDPSHFEVKKIEVGTEGLPRSFWLYLVAVAAVAAGYADFPLIAFHFKKMAITSDIWIPLFYSIAMAVDAISALVFGKLFDSKGVSVLIFVSILSAFFAPFVFLGGFYLALAGVVLWGIGMGAQESVMRAVVAEMVPIERRGGAYGVFSMGYGIFWFLGSALMGYLYDVSIVVLVAFSFVMQIVSVPFLYACRRK